MLEKSSFHFRCGGIKKIAAWSERSSKDVGDNIRLLHHSFHDIFDLHFFKVLTFLNHVLEKPLFFIGVPPHIGGSFPKDIEVAIDVLNVLFDFVEDDIQFFGDGQ